MQNTASPDLPEFYGNHKCAVEESGRLMIPTKLRLKEPYDTYRIILWPIGVDECLLVFPPWRWASFLEEMKGKPQAAEKPHLWLRTLGRTTDIATLDKVGRIVIRDDLLKKVGIGREALLVGLVSTFEVWSPERFAEAGEDSPQLAADLTAGIIP